MAISRTIPGFAIAPPTLPDAPVEYSRDDQQRVRAILRDAIENLARPSKLSKVDIVAGGKVSWDNDDVTIAHAANALAFAGASNGYSFDFAVSPATDDGASLGKVGKTWSDVFVASGAVLDFGGGLFKLTHGGGGGLAITAGTLFYAGDTSPAANNISGFSLHTGGILNATRDSADPVDVNRKTNDGTIINIRQDGTTEGGISVSGTTLTYGTFCGSHWSQLHDGGILDIPRGTIVETIDEMCSWPGEENDQLARFKVSDTPGSPRVYGVFMDWHADDMDSNDAIVASLGAYLVRIAAGETVHGGDLIESNGDGCGRVQSDNVVRACTVCKVTSNHVIETYPDGSYLVPCVLYCG